MQKWTRSRALALVTILHKHSDYEAAIEEIGESKDAIYNAFKRFNLKPPTSYLGQGVERPKQAPGGWIKVLVSNDHHVPFHHVKGMENLLRFATIQQPDHIVFNGDFLDCYSISDFERAPGMPSLQDEIDAGSEILKGFRNACPTAKMTYLEGNHEFRLERVVNRNPGFYNLKSLNIKSLLNLEEMDIDHLRYKEVLEIGPLAIKHGEAVSASAGQTVQKEVLQRGFNHVIIGHVHRLGWIHKTGFSGAKQGLENGGLFDKSQCHYNKNPDWQNGFCIAHVNVEEDKVHLEPIWMDQDGSFFHGGVYYPG